jgi:glycosyltransferase involved in cell wall biosynthesis
MTTGPRRRVLVVHNAYQQRGGEDSVVASEIALLERHGHAVTLYQRHNDEIAALGQLPLLQDTLWSRRTVREIGALVDGFRPEVIHAHNTFPLVSPSLYWAAGRHAVPVVQTLHNFRLLCPQGLLLREGRVCEDCVGHVPWRAVRHRCYRGSAAQSGAAAVMLQLHRALGTWRERVGLYIALNEFCRQKFIQGGLPADRIRVKPNFVEPVVAPAVPRAGFVFVGRLSREKGVETLAEAMHRAPEAVALRVAGSGPDAGALAAAPRTRLLGALDAAAVRAEMAGAVALVLPSIWYENFPRTLVEAFAAGLPVIASRLGAMAELVEDGVTGLLFEPGDAQDLAARLAWAAAHPEAMARMGEAAQACYRRSWSPEANHAALMAIYDEAISSARSHGRTSAGKAVA